MLTCYYCKKLFSPQRINKKNPKKYCSLDCSREAQKSQKEIHPCIVCNTATTNLKYCSKSCSATANNTGRRRWSKPESRYSIVKLCKTCGTETSRPVYCSDNCNPNRLDLTVEEKQIRSKAIHNEAWQRYMAKRKKQTPLNIDIKELQQFYLNCPNGYEVDHIIPISKGGLHCLDNLQYLTISENRRKSNKLL
jgi:HNH endonuclease